MLWKTIKRIVYLFSSVLVLLIVLKSYEALSFMSSASETVASVTGNTAESATVAYQTPFKTQIQFEASYLEAAPGDSVKVLYNPLIPAQASVNSFIQIWMVPLLLGAMLIAVVLSVICAEWGICAWRKKRNRVVGDGNHILTHYQHVEALVNKSKNGKTPYQIISTWKDRKTGQVREFRSRPLWVNPMDYILDQTIKVMIDSKNPKRYLMDLSFLPDHLLKQSKTE